MLSGPQLPLSNLATDASVTSCACDPVVMVTRVTLCFPGAQFGGYELQRAGTFVEEQERALVTLASCRRLPGLGTTLVPFLRFCPSRLREPRGKKSSVPAATPEWFWEQRSVKTRWSH